MKKIAHIVTTPVMAGAQKVCFDILSHLPESEFDRYLICGVDQYINNNDFFERFSDIGVKVIKIPSLRRDIGFHDFRCIYDLFTMFKKNKFDIVHTHSTKPGIVARIAAKLAKVNLIIHTVHGIAFHRYEKSYKRILYYTIELFASLFGNQIVTVNYNYIKYYKYIPFVSVRCIYNGVNFDSLRQCHNDIDTKSDSLNVLFLARLDKQKNPIFLLKAVNRIAIENTLTRDFKVTIVGDGPLLGECTRYVEEMNLNDIVEFKGWTNDVSLEFSQADIFCVPSNYEAFGLVFIEGAFFNLPSVSTSVEGIPEVIVHNKTGVLCEPNDVEGLSEALVLLINDNDLRIKFGEAAKTHSCNFSIAKMVDGYIDCYNQ
jgi:glycosyltransferase involved in cell wall biosynthesis